MSDDIQPRVSDDEMREIGALVLDLPECPARDAVQVALDALDGRATLAALETASADLRERYQRATRRELGDRHVERWRIPWSYPCEDPPEWRGLAACVALVYAVEALLTGQRSSRVWYYATAARGWATEAR